MASAPLNWLLKIGGATLKTTAKTLSEAVNTLHDTVTNLGTTVTNLGTTVTNLGTTVTNLGTSKADASTTTTALNNLETNKLNISDLLSLEEIEASTSLTGKGVTAESIKSLNNSLTKVKTYVGDDGKLHFIDSAGADSVLPFSTTGNYGSFTFDSSGNITITTDQEPTEVVALYKSKSSSTYNFQAYYNKNHTSMNVKISVSGNSFSINNNNSSGFGGSTGEYIWR